MPIKLPLLTSALSEWNWNIWIWCYFNEESSPVYSWEFINSYAVKISIFFCWLAWGSTISLYWLWYEMYLWSCGAREWTKQQDPGESSSLYDELKGIMCHLKGLTFGCLHDQLLHWWAPQWLLIHEMHSSDRANQL